MDNLGGKHVPYNIITSRFNPTIHRSTSTDITSGFNLVEGETITSIRLGSSRSVAITSSGRVFTWGSNNNGQLGDGTLIGKDYPIDITSQFSLTDNERVISLSLGTENSAAFTSQGRVFTWGFNNQGQLGDGTLIDKLYPVDITANFDLNEGEFISKIMLTYYVSAALSSEGRLFMWGNNDYGQLGDGTTIIKILPSEITNYFNLDQDDIIIDFSIGSQFASAITIKSRIFTWGNNEYGQLGDSTNINKTSPIEISNQFDFISDETIVHIALGSAHSMIVTSSNRVFTWGSNFNGELGTGTIINRSKPIEITNRLSLDSSDKVIKIELGSSNSALLLSSGKLFAWGRNDYGQLGDGSNLDRLNPVEVNTFNLDLEEYL